MSNGQLEVICGNSEILGVIREPNLYAEDSRYVVGMVQDDFAPTFTLARTGATHADSSPTAIEPSRVDIVLKAEEDATKLTVECLDDVVQDIPPLVIVRFIKTALLETRRHPGDAKIKISSEGMIGKQVEAIAGVGFAALSWGSFTFEQNTPDQQQKSKPSTQQNTDTIQKIGAETRKYESVLSGKTNSQWRKEADRLLEQAFAGQPTLELLEVARINCLGYMSTLPENEVHDFIDPDPMFLIDYAKCLAVLSSHTSLRPYQNIENNPDTATRNRNDDLFAYAVQKYEKAQELIGKDAPDEQLVAVSSGLAKTYEMRAKYLAKRAKIDGKAADTAEIDISICQDKALTVLRSVKNIVSTDEAAEQLNRQITDTGEWMLTPKSIDDEEPSVAEEASRQQIAA